jgi:YD repeat-containing protein
MRFGDQGETQEWLQAWSGLTLASVTDPEGRVTSYVYDLLGRAKDTTTGLGQSLETTSFAYNGRGQVGEVTDPSGLRSNFRYNVFGDLEQRSIPGIRGHWFSYDGYGRVETETRPEGEVIRNLYDHRGDTVGQRWEDENLQISDRSFDELGRVVQATNYNPRLQLLGYDKPSVTTTYEYDALGRLGLDSIWTEEGGAQAVASSWSLRSGAWKRLIKYPTDTSLTETYDKGGRLAGLERADGSGNRQSNVDYGWLGNLQRGWTHQLGEQVFVERSSFDGLGRQVGVKKNRGSDFFSSDRGRRDRVRAAAGRARRLAADHGPAIGSRGRSVRILGDDRGLHGLGGPLRRASTWAWSVRGPGERARLRRESLRAVANLLLFGGAGFAGRRR